LHQEFQIKRSVLYRWRDAYRKEGAAGLQRPTGRPPGTPNPPRVTASAEEAAARRIAELERKIGQQALGHNRGQQPISHFPVGETQLSSPPRVRTKTGRTGAASARFPEQHANGSKAGHDSRTGFAN
jgi:hypothetical protein